MDVLADHRNASDGSSLTVCPMGGMFLLSGMKSSMYWIDESPQPFNAQYIWANTSANLIIPDPEITILNPYKGGVFQQATSGVTETSKFYVHCWHSPFYIYIFKDQQCYELEQGCYSVYGFEYKPGMSFVILSGQPCMKVVARRLW